MRPGKTYYWWVDYDVRVPGSDFPQQEVAGPYSFTLALNGQPGAVSHGQPIGEPSERTTSAVASTMTVASAPTLPSSNVFDGSRSIKDAFLSDLVYKTLEQVAKPYMVAVACWTPADWQSVMAGIGEKTSSGDTVTEGFWRSQQPRWLHLSPETCTDVQALITTKQPNGRRAAALSTVIHESIHAHGVNNEAQTNCYAVQLVPLFGSRLGMGGARSTYLGTLARRYVRGHAPSDYWNAGNCRDGGAWDLEPATSNLGL